MAASEQIYGMKTFDVPLDQLQGVEEYMFGALQMDRATVMAGFDDVFEDTKEEVYESFACRGISCALPIESREGDKLYLAGDARLKSSFLVGQLELASEIVLYLVAIFGYDELVKRPGNDDFDGMFYTAWASGMSMGAHAWIRNAIIDDARERGLYAGRCWNPGEGQVEIEVQHFIGKTLNLELIGASMNETGFMSPAMSIGGLMGLSASPEIEQVGKEFIATH